MKITDGTRTLEIVDYAIGEGSDSDFTNLTFTDIQERFVTLKRGHRLSGLKNIDYTRRLVHAGKIEGIKVRFDGRVRWLVSKESVLAYKNRSIRRNKMRRYVLKLDPENEESLRSFLDSLDVPYSLELAYKGRKSSKNDWPF